MRMETNNDSQVDSQTTIDQYEALKRKYDALIEMAVHITAERDELVKKLESTQTELALKQSVTPMDTFAPPPDSGMNKSLNDSEVC